MLSGRRAFRRDTAPETMAAILNEDPPDIAASGRTIPPALARIVDRCLEKNTASRFQTASDLGFALEALSDASGSTNEAVRIESPRRPGRERIAWVVAVMLLMLLALLAFRHMREQSSVVRQMRFQFSPGVELAGPGNFSVSPDGGSVAFFGVGSDGVGRLWIRTMNSLDVRPLPGTEVPRDTPTPPPFWSPDSRFIAFQSTDFKLKKIAVSGGPAQTLSDIPGVAVGGSWNRTGDIIIGNTGGGVLRFDENGGPPTAVTTLDASKKEEFHLLPTFLPDGRHFIYLRIAPAAFDNSGTFVGTLDAKPDAQSTERLLPYEVGMTYAPAADGGPGRLLFVREGNLLAQPFDATRLAILGNPVAVAESVGSFRDGGFFSASGNDVLVYRTANSDFQIASFDRQGVRSGRVSEQAGFRRAALSPDGTRAVASRTVPQDVTKADLWLIDLSQGSGTTRLTLGNGMAEFPVWSPDGKRIAFTFNNNRVLEKLVSGENDDKELVRSTSAGLVRATNWSPDGRFLLYSVGEATATKQDVWVMPRDGGKAVPFARTPFDDDQGRFSPDGRWIAYVSDQSGAKEVYVRAFTTDFTGGSAATGETTLVSRGGGIEPRWRGDGRELFYLGGDGKIMAVAVVPGAPFTAAAPVALFQTPPGSIVGDVTADGKRFMLVTPVGASAAAPFTVVLNWSAASR
jgi:eukaryotic-like serine/threonine-protein kinase